MVNEIKNISLTLLISIGIVYICNIIESSNIFTYLDSNLLTMLLAFLAINTATLGHLAAKIQDIIVIYPQMNFDGTLKEMKKSLVEQVIMIAVAIIVIILRNSNVYVNLKKEILDVLSVSVFLYAINVLWDTGKSVFIIIEELNKIKNL